MNWLYQIRPYTWPPGFTVVCLIGLAVYAWRRRRIPGAMQFAVACLLGALWVAGYVMEFAATDAATKILWFKVHSIFKLPAITATTAFLLEYARPGKWLTRRSMAALSIVPALALVVGLTDNLHHLAWRSFAVEGTVTAQYGPISWYFLAYGLWLGLVDIAVLLWLYLRSPQHRWPLILIITVQIAAGMAFVLDTIEHAHSDLPLEILEIGLVFLTYAIMLFGFHFFDPIPVVRPMAMEDLHIGMLVLDRDGRVADFNPSARRILKLAAGQVKGRLFRELLPVDSDKQLADASGGEIELSLVAGEKVRHYSMAVSPLIDWRGLSIGRLLLLRDVTDQMNVQAQLLEQARALAMLQERDRLARELHDDLAQVLGYVKMQVRTAREHLSRNQMSVADNDLEQLEAIVQDVHADVREYILGARPGNFTASGFLPALEQYLQRFGDNYRIRTELISPPGFADGVFEPTVQVQLLRIIQEALTNSRKHAHATWVQVSVSLLDGRAQITVQDNGVGFDPAELAAEDGQKFGLQIMRERAHGIGASLKIDTVPGAGTCAVIRVPLSPQIRVSP